MSEAEQKVFSRTRRGVAAMAQAQAICGSSPSGPGLERRATRPLNPLVWSGVSVRGRRCRRQAGLGLWLAAASLALIGCAGGPQKSGALGASSIAQLSPQRADVVMAALAQIGSPYRYGRASPAEGFDCSGLVQYAHSAAGLRVPRVSTAQRAAADPVDARHPAPGDLVFFKTGPSQYHVGIMVDDQRFVHAATSAQEVRLSPLGGDYWQRRYLGAGTFVDEPRFADRRDWVDGSPFGEL